MANWLEEFWKNLTSNPLWIFGGSRGVSKAIDATQNDINVGKVLEEATGDPTGALGTVAKDGLTLTPEQEKYLDSLIQDQKTQADNAFQEHMRDTSLLSTGSQLNELGLSASGVLQAGGASSGVTSATAGHPTTNIALQRYNQQMAMAKQILGMTSQMASAGIYGHAIGAARNAAKVLTSSTSNSALKALKTASKPRKWTAADEKEWNRMMASLSRPDDEFDGYPF